MRILIAGNNSVLNTQLAETLLGYGVSETACDCESAVKCFETGIERHLQYNLVLICCESENYDIFTAVTRIRDVENSCPSLRFHSTICILSADGARLAQHRLHLSNDPNLFCLTSPLDMKELLIVARLTKTRNGNQVDSSALPKQSLACTYLKMLPDTVATPSLEPKVPAISLRM